MTQTLRVVARVIAEADKVEQLKAVFYPLVELTRSETGCIQYGTRRGA